MTQLRGLFWRSELQNHSNDPQELWGPLLFQKAYLFNRETTCIQTLQGFAPPEFPPATQVSGSTQQVQTPTARLTQENFVSEVRHRLLSCCSLSFRCNEKSKWMGQRPIHST